MLGELGSQFRQDYSSWPFLQFRRLWHLEHIESFETSLILQLLHLLAGIFIIWTLHSGISVSGVTLCDHFANFGRFWGLEMELFESGKELFELDIGWLVWVELLTILSRRNKYIWIQSKIEVVELENFEFRNLQRRRDSMIFWIGRGPLPFRDSVVKRKDG